MRRGVEAIASGGARGVDLGLERIGSQGSGWTVPLESPPLSIWSISSWLRSPHRKGLVVGFGGMGCVLASFKVLRKRFCASGDIL